MTEVRVLVLVHGCGLADSLHALARRLPWAEARGLQFVSIAGDVQPAVTEQRLRAGSIPIGVIAGAEQTVLAAIASGADEATVMHAADEGVLAAFVDRTELRARLRAEEQQLKESVAHADKLTALGTLVAGIAHEINNPLAAMMLSIDAARRHLLPVLDLSTEIASAARDRATLPEDALLRLARLGEGQDRAGRDAARVFDDIGTAAESIASIVRDLRVFARTDQEEPLALVGVEEIVDQALRLTGRELFPHAVVERDYPADLPKLVLPRNRVTQVVINILINAAHAVRELDRPEHRVRISARADEEFVAVAISDTGPGIVPEALDRVFDPFFTTKRQELGMGLGLSISRSILRQVGGDLSVESVYGSGATFLCFLPIPSREMVRAAFARKDRRVVTTPSARTSHHTVLVVEDDERVLRSYVRLLNPLYRLLIAPDGCDAIELLQTGSSPDAIVFELDLPGADGRALLAWLAENRPDLRRRVLMVTSAGSKRHYESFLSTYDGPVLHKPVHGEHLIEQLATLLC